ncbi:hypothetical protein RB195_010470 [Necator americanus]
MTPTEVTEEIKHNIYVDNVIMGAQSTEEARKKYPEAKVIFNDINMNLREFISNDRNFNDALREEDRMHNSCPKVLGIPWSVESDNLILKGAMPTRPTVTKRSVSHQLASIYDPLGLMVPLLLPAKLFLQSLWRENFDWDTPLPDDLQQKWTQLSDSIHHFTMTIDRRMCDSKDKTRLFVFADGSQHAIASCVYLRFRSPTHLGIAKSKLPSLKSDITTPKQEMNAMTLSLRLARYAHQSLHMVTKLDQIFFFTDSEIVLGWIKSPPEKKSVGVLVTNRLREVRNIIRNLKEQGVTCHFGYVPTMENPADCGTRGLTASPLQDHFWWHGPDFISKDINEWPPTTKPFSITVEEEVHENPNLVMLAIPRAQEESSVFNLRKFNSLPKAQRVVSYVMRFITRLLAHFPTPRKREFYENIPALKTASNSRELRGNELREARKAIIRDHQNTTVTPHQMKSQKDLNIQRDEEGILRCYGRLQKSDLPDTATAPIYIASKSALAQLIIMEYHSNYHQGMAHTISSVRNDYWIPSNKYAPSSRNVFPAKSLIASHTNTQEWNPSREPAFNDLDLSSTLA